MKTRWTTSALLANAGVNLSPLILFLSGQSIPTANYILSAVFFAALIAAIIYDRRP